MFQFLIGWLQTFFIIPHLLPENLRFNSLQVGYKPGCTHCDKSKSIVSIPYRLATNTAASKVCSSQCLFQFLIGWLQTTHLHNNEFIAKISFNSLQVGYKQNYTVHTAMLTSRFQFLIGWLQTNLPISYFDVIISFNSLQVGYKLYSAPGNSNM